MYARKSQKYVLTEPAQHFPQSMKMAVKISIPILSIVLSDILKVEAKKI